MNAWQQQRERLRRAVSKLRTPGTFLRNAFFTSADAAANILLQLAFTPVLARLYSPEAYGVFGLFSSLSANLSSLGGMGYPLAFALPKSEDRFLALVRLTGWMLLITVGLTLPFFLFPDLLYSLVPSWRILGNWCMAVPLMVAATGAGAIFIAWYNRVKAFGRFARANTLTNLSLRLSSMGFGLWAPIGFPGLLASEVWVRAAAVVHYVRDLRIHGVARMLRPVPRATLRSAALEYKEYPLYVFPGRWLSLFAQQLPIYGLVGMGLQNETGQFTMAAALLLVPLRLFGYSLYGVFLRRAIDAGAEKLEEMADITKRMYDRLLLLGVLPMIGITFFGDRILLFALGNAWEKAGVFAAMLGPFYFYRLLSEPLSAVFIALRNERSLLLFNLLVLISSALALGLAYLQQGGAEVLVGLFGTFNAVAYAIMGAAVLRAVRLPWVAMVGRTVLFAGAVALSCAVLRWYLFGNLWPGT
jgi:O-antigen/teichoic acid export membrane protein